MIILIFNTKFWIKLLFIFFPQMTSHFFSPEMTTKVELLKTFNAEPSKLKKLKAWELWL